MQTAGCTRVTVSVEFCIWVKGPRGQWFIDLCSGNPAVRHPCSLTASQHARSITDHPDQTLIPTLSLTPPLMPTLTLS